MRLRPRGHADELLGFKEGVLQARVSAPPVDGKANKALCGHAHLFPLCGKKCVRTLAAWIASCSHRRWPRPVSLHTAPRRCGSGSHAGRAPTRR
ncbi:MAG: DUF167 domain-containing protein [Solirubrobacterales bacterium]